MFVFGKISFVVEQCGPLVADRVVGGTEAGRAGAAAVFVDRHRRRGGNYAGGRVVVGCRVVVGGGGVVGAADGGVGVGGDGVAAVQLSPAPR